MLASRTKSDENLKQDGFSVGMELNSLLSILLTMASLAESVEFRHLLTFGRFASDFDIAEIKNKNCIIIVIKNKNLKVIV